MCIRDRYRRVKTCEKNLRRNNCEQKPGRPRLTQSQDIAEILEKKGILRGEKRLVRDKKDEKKFVKV